MKALVTIFNDRLIRLADFLQGLKTHPEQGTWKCGFINIVAIEGRVKIHYSMKYPIWVFDTITFIEPISQEEGVIAGIIDYYNLTQDEFGHLFDMEGFQLIEHFGGMELNINSTPLQISENIREFVRRREGNP